MHSDAVSRARERRRCANEKRNKLTQKLTLLITLVTTAYLSSALADTKLVPIGRGWAKNSVNANILRHNSVVSHENNQYVAYYAEDGSVVLSKRMLGSEKGRIKGVRNLFRRP